MAIRWIQPEYEVVRDQNRCILCRACERQCSKPRAQTGPGAAHDGRATTPRASTATAACRCARRAR